MEDTAPVHYLWHISSAVAVFLLLAIILPLAPVFIIGQPLGSTLALMTSTFVIEYGAAPIGIGMGLHPVPVLFTLVCIAAGVTFLLFGIFDTLGKHSVKVAAFLEKTKSRAGGSKFISRYGIYGLIPCVMTLGIYACPPVSWILGWDRTRSIVLILTGYILISVVTILASIGILRIFFP
jgi:uncharacterized membrane protein